MVIKLGYVYPQKLYKCLQARSVWRHQFQIISFPIYAFLTGSARESIVDGHARALLPLSFVMFFLPLYRRNTCLSPILHYSIVAERALGYKEHLKTLQKGTDWNTVFGKSSFQGTKSVSQLHIRITSRRKWKFPCLLQSIQR